MEEGITPEHAVNACKTIKIKKLTEDCKTPTKSKDGDAMFDIYTNIGGLDSYRLEPGELYKFKTGFATEIPPGFYMKIHERSGVSSNKIAVRGGIIDSNYRGEWMIMLHNLGERTYLVNSGDRIAQASIEEVIDFEFEEVDELSESNRGDEGFGASGR